MKTTLFKILWKKELNHWKQFIEMQRKFKGWGVRLTIGLIFSIFFILGHYGFALMSTLWETFLWIVARKYFKANLQRMALTV